MKRQYSKPTAEKLDFDYKDAVVASDIIYQEETNNGDVGKGKGRGGGCDKVPNHTNERSFSNGKNSGC